MLLLLLNLPWIGVRALYDCLLMDNISVQLPRLFLMMAILAQCYGLSCMLLPPILYPFITVLISSYVAFSAALSVYITASEAEPIKMGQVDHVPAELLQQYSKKVTELLSGNMSIVSPQPGITNQ